MKGNVKKGFTLLEVLIASTMLLAVTGAVMTLLMSATNFFETATVDSALSVRAQIAIDQVKDGLTGVYREDLNIPTSATSGKWIYTYTSTVAWDTTANAPDYGSPVYSSKFTWDMTAKTLAFTPAMATATPQIIAENVANFKIRPVDDANHSKYIIFLTLALPTNTTAASTDWITQEVRESVYLYTKPN